MNRWRVFQGQCLFVAILFLLSVSVAPAEAYQSNEQVLKDMGFSGSSTGPLVEINEIALDAVSGSAVVSGTEEIVDGNVRMNIRTDGFDPGRQMTVQAGSAPAAQDPPQADPEVAAVLENLSRSGYTYTADGDHRYEVKISAEALQVLNQSERKALEEVGFIVRPDGGLVQMVDTSVYSITNTTTQETGQMMVSRALDPAGSPVGERRYSIRPYGGETMNLQEAQPGGFVVACGTKYDKQTRVLQWVKVGILIVLVAAMIAALIYVNSTEGAFHEQTKQIMLHCFEDAADEVRMYDTNPDVTSFAQFDRDYGGRNGKAGMKALKGLRIIAIITGIILVLLLIYEIYWLGIYEGWWTDDSLDTYVWSYQHSFSDADNGKRATLDVNSRFALALFADTRSDENARWAIKSGPGLVSRDNFTQTTDNGTIQSWLFTATEPGPHNLVLKYITDQPVPATIPETTYTFTLNVEGRKWDLQTIASTKKNAGTGQYTSLVIDRSGIPHISYYDAAKERIMYARLDGMKWTYEKVADSAGTYATSIALDAAGNPAISFGDGLHYGNLMYATRNGTQWDTGTVDTGSAGNAGQYTSLVIDRSGIPHIVYNDGLTFATLKYATRNGSTWEISTVDNAGAFGNAGYDSSLVLDKAGVPHVSYRDGTQYANLMYAVKDGDGWTTTVVDRGNASTGNTGYYSSLALDTAGNPHIAYYDAKNQDLRYASVNDAGWMLETIDSAGDIGQYASLAIDSQDQPHIAYYDASNHELRYATRETGSADWTIRTVDNDGDVGQYATIALDPAGHPCFSYDDAANRALKYAGWTG